MTTHKAPLNGVDDKVWTGVLVGLNAMRVRNTPPEGKVAHLPIDRHNQRMFKLPDTLEENESAGATVVLNGVHCVVDRDYAISGNILNWVSARSLFMADSLAVRYHLGAGSAPVTVPAVTPSYVNIRDHSNVIKTAATKVINLEKAVEDSVKMLEQRMAELETVTASVSTDIDSVAAEVADIGSTLSEIEEKEEDTQDIQKEDEEMIAPGAKVWHRLTGEGPWIVVQNTVLNINSRQEGGEENRFKTSYVELAWTVQTEDGVRDFPEVVLTMRKPKAESMSLVKKLAIGACAVTTVAAIVHAPLLIKLLGLLQQ